mgnify:CR=1 FL=1
MSSDYQKSVADYYDEEASTFEDRAGNNPVLSELRRQFREVVLAGEIDTILEIGYGPGLDMVWFAQREETSLVHGLDITPNFHSIVKSKSVKNTKLNPMLGPPEDILNHVPANSIDTIYIFFGALNPCSDLEQAVDKMQQALKPGGRIVATFVNKWYAFEILWNLLTLRPNKAFARLKKIWGGLIGVYPNSSSYNNSKNFESTEWAFKQVMQKEKFIDYAKIWTDFGVDFIGGCCGVNVDHIKELKKIIK